ncbi:MAG TPA: sphingosine kinase [Firmicutes bacterium]|nr:sphingosine kinase [Bacillota bacterium]
MNEPLKLKGFESCMLLINPTRYPQYVKMLKRMLKKTEIPLVIESRSKTHFIDSVHQFHQGDFKYLLVWGGDGTAHDAINAFMSTKPEIKTTIKKSIGFLRGGSGNGIQDSYEVPFSLRRQLYSFAESMANNFTIDVDLLKVRQDQQIFYSQLVGFGFDAQVLSLRNIQKTLREGNIKSGLLNYAASAVAAFIKNDLKTGPAYILDLHHGKYALRGTRTNAEFPIDSLRLTVDSPMIEVGTRPYYGKLFKICPDVVCNDGYMDLYLFNFESKMAIAGNIIALWNGRHDKINQRFAKKDKLLIQRFEIKQLELHAGAPFDFHIDGEFKTAATSENGLYSIFIEVVPQAIPFIVPKTFYRKFHPFDKGKSNQEGI